MTRSGSRVTLRLGALCLRAGLWPTIATLALMPMLVGLGVWQLERAKLKLSLQEEYDRRATEPALRLHPVVEDAASLLYRRVQVRGHYEPDHQILHDNRVYQGQAGYHVLTPFVIENGTVRVLVNRGWLPMGQDRRLLPQATAPAGETEISGVAVLPPEPGLRLGAAAPSGPGLPVLWQNLELGAIVARLQQPFQPVILLLDPDVAEGGYVRAWPRLETGVTTSQSYAFQWFTMAIALAAIYILVNTHRCEDEDAEQTR